MVNLLSGDPAPNFTGFCNNNPQYHFNTVAGRYVVLCFFGSVSLPNSYQALSFVYQDLRSYFDDNKICFFGVSIDPQDKQSNRIQDMLPGIRIFWDLDLRVSTLYGAVTLGVNLLELYKPYTLILDPNLRVLANIPLSDAQSHNQQIKDIIENLPSVDDYAEVPLTAPILIVPRVFDRTFCRQLIDLYHEKGGTESGFMREKDGKTIGVQDYSFKRRQDCPIESEEIINQMKNCLSQRLVPEIAKVYNFRVTRIERYIVACYDSESGGYFRPHRDNTTKGTAHRRFAVTINLNAEEYEGGDLRFPEFGSKTYRAPTGGAVVFSCSVLHEATPVTKGVRYATLPFLYDEEGAKIREANQQFLTNQMINLNQS